MFLDPGYIRRTEALGYEREYEFAADRTCADCGKAIADGAPFVEVCGLYYHEICEEEF